MRVKSITLALLVGVAMVSASETSAQTPSTRALELTFNADGTVTLAAQNVTAREVLAEWARRCGCYVINAEKMVGGPITMPVRFENAQQGVVLESLLRQTAGFALTPRRAGATGPSQFETIYVLATSNPSASAYSSPAYPSVQAPPVTPGSPADEIPPAVQQQLNMQPQPGQQSGQQMGAPQPGQQQPGQPGQQQPGQPGQPQPGGVQQQPINRPGPTGPGVFVPITPIGPTSPGAPGLPTKGGGTTPTPPLGGGVPIRGGGGL